MQGEREIKFFHESFVVEHIQPDEKINFGLIPKKPMFGYS